MLLTILEKLKGVASVCKLIIVMKLTSTTEILIVKTVLSDLTNKEYSILMKPMLFVNLNPNPSNSALNTVEDIKAIALLPPASVWYLKFLLYKYN